MFVFCVLYPPEVLPHVRAGARISRAPFLCYDVRLQPSYRYSRGPRSRLLKRLAAAENRLPRKACVVRRFSVKPAGGYQHRGGISFCARRLL